MIILLVLLLEILGDTLSYTLSAQQSNDLESFVLVSQPSDAIKEQGESYTMSCIVQGSGTYTYSWYKSPTLTKGSHSKSNSVEEYLQTTKKETLSFASLKPSDTGYYHCKVTSGNFTIISNTGYLKIVYYDEVPEQKKSKSVQENSYSAILKCDVPNSDKAVTITWKKDNEEISDPRMFVIPNGATDSNDKAGQLHIFNVKKADADVYTCSGSYDDGSKIVTKKLTKIFLSVEGKISGDNKAPNIIFKTENVNSVVGGVANFYCAGSGKPTPMVSWSSKSGSSIQSSDSVFLTDNDRKLKIGNVHNALEKEYRCTVSNTAGDRTAIMYLSITPTTYDITFRSKPDSHVIYHNKYTPFKLECSVEKQDTQMYWLKNGEYLAYSDRILTKPATITLNGTKIQSSTLEFVTPNESDLGIYQCMVENSEKMRQATAYLNVKKESDYDNNVDTEKEYKVIPTPKKVDAAEEECQVWRKYGHLVSIMNEKEAKEVLALMSKDSITTSWIGLTRENPNTPGYWKWTQPADHSTSFSFWFPGTPDNKGEDEAYAIMDKDHDGNWLDISNDEEHPFVCKNYLATCPSITTFFNKRALPTTVMETSSTTYGIGEEITIACTDTSVKIKEVVTCKPSGQFDPDTILCPIYQNDSEFIKPFYIFNVLISTFFLLL